MEISDGDEMRFLLGFCKVSKWRIVSSLCFRTVLSEICLSVDSFSFLYAFQIHRVFRFYFKKQFKKCLKLFRNKYQAGVSTISDKISQCVLRLLNKIPTLKWLRLKEEKNQWNHVLWRLRNKTRGWRRSGGAASLTIRPFYI